MLPTRPPNIFEYVLVRGRPLNLGDVQVLSKDLAQSIVDMHSKGIFHLNLQPSDLLVINSLDPQTPGGNDEVHSKILHLTNFCSSSSLLKNTQPVDKPKALLLTQPEKIRGEVNIENKSEMAKADVWSMGAILYMLVFGKVPPEKNSKSLIVEAIKKSNIKLEDSGWHNNLKSFI